MYDRPRIPPRSPFTAARAARLLILASVLAGGASATLSSSLHAQQTEGLKKRPPGAKSAVPSKPTPAVEPRTAISGSVRTPGPGEAASGAKTAGAAPAGQDADVPLLQRVVGFIKDYAVWILAALGAGFLATVALTFLGRRRSRGPIESPFAELGIGEPPSRGQKFSSTKIAASDVADRLSVKTTEVETDREYALIVDEEALKMPPLPEDESAPSYDPTGIKKRLAEKDLEGAYTEYAGVIDADPGAALDPEVERSLGEELLRARQLDKAARVLEHHVATHRARGIPPECYFNLGYVHFLKKTYKKSTRFLKLFVMAGKNPTHVARAKKILERIEKAENLN